MGLDRCVRKAELNKARAPIVKKIYMYFEQVNPGTHQTKNPGTVLVSLEFGRHT